MTAETSVAEAGPVQHDGRDGDRVAVIDIGSNSLRCVVFAATARALQPLYNDKVMCSIGRGLAARGTLDPAGVQLARANLRRFAALIRGLGVQPEQTICVGTAAMREAADGPDFADEIRREIGLNVRVIGGDEEARLSALGVVSSIPDAHGVVGDLGGGSLELVAVEHGRLGAHDTLPLGPFRLMTQGEPKALADFVDRQIASLGWLGGAKGATLYPVGGAWRAIARVHMDHASWPLRVIHHYRISGREAADIASLIARAGNKSMRLMRTVPKRRREMLPYAALTLERLVRRLQPEAVVFSAYGLREGLIYDRLDEAAKRADPLIEACRDMARHGARFVVPGEAFADWMAGLFRDGDDPRARRLRLAACWLGDIAGLDHPDYRGEHAFLRVLRMAAVGLDHADRAFLALAVLARYEGVLDLPIAGPARRLIGRQEDEDAALVVGLALRLAYALAPGGGEVISRTRLVVRNGRVTIDHPADLPLLLGEMVETRLADLGEAYRRLRR